MAKSVFFCFIDTMSRVQSPIQPSDSSWNRISSPLGLGTWVFGGGYWGDQDQKESRKVIEAALKGGLRHFDTAPSYGTGRAEQILGQATRKIRETLVLSSKFFPTLPENVEKGLRRSLRRLSTSYLDIYYLHWPNEKCDIRGIMEELERARHDGLIRAVGVSNFSPGQMETLSRWGKIDFCQTAYNLLWRYPERELIPFCRENEIIVAAYSPLAQGLVSAGPEKLSQFKDGRTDLIFLHPSLRKDLERFLTGLSAASEKEGMTSSRAALCWVLEHPSISITLTGARTAGQMKENLKVSALPVPGKLHEELQGLSEEFQARLGKQFPEATNMWNHVRA